HHAETRAEERSDTSGHCPRLPHRATARRLRHHRERLRAERFRHAGDHGRTRLRHAGAAGAHHGDDDDRNRRPFHSRCILFLLQSKGSTRVRKALFHSALLVLAVFAAAALLAPQIAPYDPNAQDLVARLEAPSTGHWLGTDEYGRDQLSRLIFG